MQLSMQLSYSGDRKQAARLAQDLEQAGLDVVWVAEAYSFDAPSYMGYLAAQTERVQIGAGILPIYSRTPALTAMTAAGIDALSDGRCILGLGASGPQVIEGFHGVKYDNPLARTREVIEICRKVWKREAPLSYDGPIYRLPLPAEEGTGLGKPLKIINHLVRPSIPIFIAALGEKNIELTAELADGWLPLFFIPERAHEVFSTALSAGRARRDPSLGPLQVRAGGPVAIGEEREVTHLRDLARPHIALYVGGMGAKDTNFYNMLIRRYGFEREAESIQNLYLSGQKKAAEAAVPTELLEKTSLIGPEGYVQERIEAFAAAGVTMLNVTPLGPEPVATVEKLRNLLG